MDMHLNRTRRGECYALSFCASQGALEADVDILDGENWAINFDVVGHDSAVSYPP